MTPKEIEYYRLRDARMGREYYIDTASASLERLVLGSKGSSAARAMSS